MYYLYKEFSHFIMTIRASIMERDQSSNRNRNQRKYTKLNHLVQLTVILIIMTVYYDSLQQLIYRMAELQSYLQNI